MKMGIVKSFCIALLIACTIGAGNSRLSAQARPSPKSNVISVGLLSLVQVPGMVLFQYEWRSGPVNSIALRAAFQTGYLGYSGFLLGGAYRFFIADSRALTGLSVAPAIDILIYGNSAIGRNYTSFDIGGDLAYKWIFDAFSVEPIVFLRLGIAGGEGLSAYSGVRPGIDVMLGYAF